MDKYLDGVQITQAVGGSLTNRSSTITTGNTSQQAAAANPARKGIWIGNSSSGDLWYNFTGAAVVSGSGSVKLGAGSVHTFAGSFVPTNALNIVGATAAAAYTIWEG